jgi:uncharacterized membrane protein
LADTNDSIFPQPPNSVGWWAIKRKERQMKKTALILATVATLAAAAIAPAEARGLHRGAGLAAAAIAATVAAEAYGYGPGYGYYYGPAAVVYGAPVYYGVVPHRYFW